MSVSGVKMKAAALEIPRVMSRIDSYANHFACFTCRKMFNKNVSAVVEQYASITQFHDQFRPPCPQCQRPMLNMGIGFKPPKRSEVRRWRNLERQAKAGKRFWFIPSWL